MLLSQIVTGLLVGTGYALLAIAVVLVYSCTRTLSIAMGEIGAFGLFAGLRVFDGRPLVAGVVAIAFGLVLGLAVERVVVRPLVRRPPLDALIATLGVALLLALLELKIYGVDPVPAPSPVGTGRFDVLGATVTAPRVAALVVLLLTAGGLYLFLSRTRFGLATRAATSDPTVARLLGVPVNRVYQFAWGLGGALSGLVAAVVVPTTTSLSPFDQTRFALSALAGAVIGGLDNVWGAILGCLLVGVVEQVVKANATSSANGYASMAVLVLVLATLLVRPRGLLGTAGAA
jgi:branched-chain amino acid transport system permease protein